MRFGKSCERKYGLHILVYEIYKVVVMWMLAALLMQGGATEFHAFNDALKSIKRQPIDAFKNIKNSFNDALCSIRKCLTICNCTLKWLDRGRMSVLRS